MAASGDLHAALLRMRSRKLRRRTLMACIVAVCAIAGWEFVSRQAPASLAPPAPEEVGKTVALGAARQSARTINAVYSSIADDHRVERKRAFQREAFNADTASQSLSQAVLAFRQARDSTSRETSTLDTTRPQTQISARALPAATEPVAPAPVRIPESLATRPVVAAPAKSTESLAQNQVVSAQKRFPETLATHPVVQTPIRLQETLAAQLHKTGNGQEATRSDPLAVPPAPAGTGIAGRPARRTGPRDGLDTVIESSVDILLIGIDTRLGREQARADAIHLLTIERDPVRVAILSIPRGTPCALGYENPGSNIISHARSARGQEGFLRRVATLCGRPPIRYYAEVGFSQAMGVLELLGSPDPMADLQSMRRRKGYTMGDHERSYRQGEFIRVAIPRALRLAEGLTGELLVKAALRLVDTNIPADVALGLAYTLSDAGFSREGAGIRHAVFGKFGRRFERREERTSVPAALVRVNASGDEGKPVRAESILRSALAEASHHRAAPREVAKRLGRYISQRAWLQIPDGRTRALLRDSLVTEMRGVYRALNDSARLASLNAFIAAEDLLFKVKASAR